MSLCPICHVARVAFSPAAGLLVELWRHWARATSKREAIDADPHFSSPNIGCGRQLVARLSAQKVIDVTASNPWTEVTEPCEAPQHGTGSSALHSVEAGQWTKLSPSGADCGAPAVKHCNSGLASVLCAPSLNSHKHLRAIGGWNSRRPPPSRDDVSRRFGVRGGCYQIHYGIDYGIGDGAAAPCPDRIKGRDSP